MNSTTRKPLRVFDTGHRIANRVPGNRMGNAGKRAHALVFLALCVAASPGCDNRDAETQTTISAPPQDSTPTLDVPLFEDAASDLGLDFTFFPGTPGQYFFPEIMAGGAALLDVDNDGDLDLFVLNGGEFQGGHPVDLKYSNRLFRQESDGRFTDVTQACGLESDRYSLGVAVGDVNNDGHCDLYVTNYGPDQLYLNQGNGTFRDVSAEAGIDNPLWGASAVMLDYDRDGLLDIYVTNYVDYHPSSPCFDSSGKKAFCDPSSFRPTVDRLFRNESQGTDVRFANVTDSAGISSRTGPGLGVVAADFTADGWLDLYVANDGTANFLWVNQRDGTFRDEGVLLGCALDGQGRPQAGMGIAVADLNEDQRPDILVTHLASENNALYVSGELGFREMSVAIGLGVPSYPHTGFGTGFADLDHDGYLDAVVVNGAVGHGAGTEKIKNDPGSREFWSPYAQPNQIYLNRANKKFLLRQSPTDPFDAARDVSRGLCLGDLDNDGDLDAVVINTASPMRVFRNVAKKQGHWLGLRLIDPTLGGREVVGARVRVKAGDRTWTRWSAAGGSYLAASDSRLHFGLGNCQKIDSLQVDWPSGETEMFSLRELDRYHLLKRGTGATP